MDCVLLELHFSAVYFDSHKYFDLGTSAVVCMLKEVKAFGNCGWKVLIDVIIGAGLGWMLVVGYNIAVPSVFSWMQSHAFFTTFIIVSV